MKPVSKAVRKIAAVKGSKESFIGDEIRLIVGVGRAQLNWQWAWDQD
jgi:hypothetical protein